MKIKNWKKELEDCEPLFKWQIGIYKSLMEVRRGNPDFAKDPLFRAAYCEFYDIKIYKKEPENSIWLENYFAVMDKYNRKNKMSPVSEKEICDVIDDIRMGGRNDLSFASKLLHTINPNVPIWDTNVKEMLGGSLKEKSNLNNYLELGPILKEELNSCSDAIKEFEDRYKVENRLKSLDFILWALGKKSKMIKRVG